MNEVMNYQQRKEDIRQRLREAAENFVYIGWQLKQVLEQKEYEADGYKDILEFAKAEYGLGKDETYRFIRINTRYSEGGNSPKLAEQFRGLHQSKLAEMLTLPDGDLELITEKTTREEIRELNRFNRQQEEEQLSKKEPEEQPAQGFTGPLQTIIKDFFAPTDKRPKDLVHPMLIQLLDIVSGKSEDPVLSQEEQLQECINPKGNSSFRKGRFFLFLYEAKEGMKYKIFGSEEVHSITYLEFAKMTHLMFTIAKREGMDEWESVYKQLKASEKEENKKEEIEPESDKEEKKVVEAIPDTEAWGEKESFGQQDTQKKEKRETEDLPVRAEEKSIPESPQAPVDKIEPEKATEKSYPQKKQENTPVAPAQQIDSESQEEYEHSVEEDAAYWLKKDAESLLEIIKQYIEEKKYDQAKEKSSLLLNVLTELCKYLENKNEQIEGQINLISILGRED